MSSLTTVFESTPVKIDAVRKVAALYQILNIVLSCYYCRFIRNFAELAEPLTRLLRDVPFEWTDVEKRSFKEINENTSSEVSKL